MAFSSKEMTRLAFAVAAGAAAMRRFADKLDPQPAPDFPEEPEGITIEDIMSQMPDDYKFRYSWILITRKEVPPLGDSEQKPWAFAVLDAASEEPVAHSAEGFASRAEAVQAGEKVAAFFDRAQAEQESTETATHIGVGMPRQLVSPQPTEGNGAYL